MSRQILAQVRPGSIKRMVRLAHVGMLVVVSSCGSVDPSPDFDRAAVEVERTTGVMVDSPTERSHARDVAADARLHDPLTLEAAVKLGLINSRALQAEFMGIGIAKADWVRSKFPANPVLSLDVLLPEGGGRSFLGAGLVESVLDLWNISARREIAQHQLDAAVHSVAAAANRIAAEVRGAYFEVMASEGDLARAEEDARTATDLLATSTARRHAGVAIELEEQVIRLQVLQAEAEVNRARFREQDAYRKLRAALSMEPSDAPVSIVNQRLRFEPGVLDSGLLEELASKVRPEMQIHEHAILAALATSTAEERQALGPLDVGLRMEREARRSGDGSGIDSKIGPTVAVSIPLVDFASIARSRGMHVVAKLLAERDDLSARIRRDAQGALAGAMHESSNVRHYEEKILPQAGQILASGLRAFRAGRTTIVEVLNLKQMHSDVQKQFNEAQHRFAVSLGNLQLVVGLPLDTICRRCIPQD